MESTDEMPIGRWIARERRQLGISQARFAEAVGISHRTLTRIETGVYQPTLPMVQKITVLLSAYDRAISEAREFLRAS